jgi:hypothetical protein
LSALVFPLFGIPPYGLTIQQNSGMEAAIQELRLSSNGVGPLRWQVGGYYAKQDGYVNQDTYLVALQQVVALAQRYGARKIAVEQAAQQLQFIDQLRQQVLAVVPNCQVEMVKPGGKAKAQRILGLETYFQRGKVYIGKGAGFHEFRTQYSQFPRTARVDLLDALAYGPHVWPRLLTKRLPNDARKRAELTAYYTRRGMDPSTILGNVPQ